MQQAGHGSFNHIGCLRQLLFGRRVGAVANSQARAGEGRITIQLAQRFGRGSHRSCEQQAASIAVDALRSSCDAVCMLAFVRLQLTAQHAVKGCGSR